MIERRHKTGHVTIVAELMCAVFLSTYMLETYRMILPESVIKKITYPKSWWSPCYDPDIRSPETQKLRTFIASSSLGSSSTPTQLLDQGEH